MRADLPFSATRNDPQSAPRGAASGSARRLQVDARLLVQGVTALLVSQGFTWFAAAIVTFTVPRYLGSANLGKYSFAVALFGLTELCSDLGIGTYLNRQVARDPSSAPRLFTAALASRLVLGDIAAGGLAVVFNVFFNSDPVVRLTVDVLCANVVVDSLAVAGITLNGLLQVRWIALAQALNKLVVAALVVLALRGGYGAPGVALASLAGALVSHAVNVGALLTRVRPAPVVDVRVCRNLVVGGLPFFMGTAALIVYSQIDTVMLAALTNPSVVGWYNAALRVIAIPAFVPVIVMAVTFPGLAAAARQPAQFRTIARRAVQVILVTNVPVGIGMILLPNRLTEFFRYPADFSHSWPLIVLLALGMPLIGVDMVIGGALAACEKQAAWTRVAIAAAFLNPLVNLFAIPYTQSRYGNGAIGAAAVTSLTELFMMVTGLRLLPRGTMDLSVVVGALRVGAACVPLAVVAWLTREQPLVVPLVLGGLAYGSACLATGAVTAQDLREIFSNLVRRRQVASA